MIFKKLEEKYGDYERERLDREDHTLWLADNGKDKRIQRYRYN